MPQCLCLTLKGQQCTRNARSGSDYCLQHKDCQKAITIKKEKPKTRDNADYLPLEYLPQEMLLEVARSLDCDKLNNLCFSSKNMKKLCDQHLRDILKSTGFDLESLNTQELFNLCPIQKFQYKLSDGLFVTDMGQVIAWGYGLGTENRYIAEPELVTTLAQTKVVQVSTGEYHSLFLTNMQQVYTCGGDDRGQLGLGDIEEVADPTLINALSGVKIIQVCAGFIHSLFLTNMGQVYACGSNEFGELGLMSKNVFVKKPELITLLKDVKIIQVSASFYSLFLTQTGHVYGCGTSFRDQLEITNEDEDEDPAIPILIKSLSHLKIVQISAGGNHSLFLTDMDQVYGCGNNEKGQLGFVSAGRHHFQRTPLLIETLKNIKIIQISAGMDHSLFLNDLGQVYACGQNKDGLLGLDMTQKEYDIPTLIKSLVHIKIIQVYAGGSSSYFLAQTGQVYASGTASDFGIKIGKEPIAELISISALNQFNQQLGGYHSNAIKRKMTHKRR